MGPGLLASVASALLLVSTGLPAGAPECAAGAGPESALCSAFQREAPSSLELLQRAQHGLGKADAPKPKSRAGGQAPSPGAASRPSGAISTLRVRLLSALRKQPGRRLRHRQPQRPPPLLPRLLHPPQHRCDWQGQMKMTHYWDCSGQACDSATLQPWDVSKYVSPPGYAPQDPMDFGGPLYGEAMWLTGAASDALTALMGPDDGCCGADANGGGGCGKCALVQNPDSIHPDWTAVVMKKNRCPPWATGCGASTPHFDIAAPGFDNLAFSTANICGNPGTGFQTQEQSAVLGEWYTQCANTDECIGLCDTLPADFRNGCRLFASWGWTRGNPSSVSFRAVECPPEFVQHVRSQFGPSGPL